MTPEEKAVIEAAVKLYHEGQNDHWTACAVVVAVDALIFSCPRCNAGGHACPGDGNPIGHTQTDCGQHEEQEHAGADGSCPDHGSTLDPCPPGCALGRCVVNDCRCSRTERVYCHAENCHGGADVQEWVPATFGDLWPGDRVRIGTQEADVTRANRGHWHARNRVWIDDKGRERDHQTPWEHEELNVDLTANPGLHDYDPDIKCEILADADRRAALIIQQAFPGTNQLTD